MKKTLKLVSWNACGKFREKFPLFSQFDADILVIQECEDPSQNSSNEYRYFSQNYFWTGENKNKGLGLFGRFNLKLKLLNWNSFGLRNFLPIQVERSFKLLGVWACKPYIEEFFIYEKIHHQHFNRNCIIIGDFNSNACWDKLHGRRNHSAVVDALSARGLQSAYHFQTGEDQGRESRGTFHLYRQKSRSYHIDYCFCDPQRIVNFRILDDDFWLNYSDHFPIEITIKFH